MEKQLEAGVVRDALASNLRLASLGRCLRLVASQWLLPGPDGAGVLDLLALDIDSGDLVVVELKMGNGAGAAVQVRRYVEILRAHLDETGPFFVSLARAMAARYGCHDLPADLRVGSVRGLVAWPAANGRLQVAPA